MFQDCNSLASIDLSNFKINSKSIDIDFYSRQIRTFGLDTTKNIMKMKVLIYGIRGLGMEIAKNIILMGPNSVSLYDKNLITHYDLGSGFYFTEVQINKENRDEGCVNKLVMLNPYVDVNVLKNEYDPEGNPGIPTPATVVYRKGYELDSVLGDVGEKGFKNLLVKSGVVK